MTVYFNIDKDFIGVLSMDGVVTFYEQEAFAFQAFLPDFLLPGPFVYISSSDSFVFGASDRSLQCYKLENFFFFFFFHILNKQLILKKVLV